MKEYTFHQIDYKVKYFMEQLTNRQFRIVTRDPVCRSFWLTYTRLIRANENDIMSNKPAPDNMVSAAHLWIEKCVQLIQEDNKA